MQTLSRLFRGPTIERVSGGSRQNEGDSASGLSLRTLDAGSPLLEDSAVQGNLAERADTVKDILAVPCVRRYSVT